MDGTALDLFAGGAPQTWRWITWGALGLLLYTWVGYPLLLWLLERCLYRPITRGASRPTVSVLVIAHNEEATIVDKIHNLRALRWPEGKLDITVASDGSYDETCARTEALAGDADGVPVRLLAFPTRRGKPAILNDVVPTLTGEIVVLCHARQRLDEDCLERLLEPFEDPEVGGVSGDARDFRVG